jgi:hypothetical protein
MLPLFSSHGVDDEVRPRNDKRGVDLIPDVLPFSRLRYGEPNALSNAVSCAGGERFEKASKSLDKRKD